MVHKNKDTTVLITGGTSGIGFALAKKFIREGCRVILVASRRKRLERAKKMLEGISQSAGVEIICQDLSLEEAAGRVYQEVARKHLSVDILVNNAGFGMTGEAVANDVSREEAMLRLNIQTVTQLCELYLREMYQRGSGKILNVASVGAFMPGPYTASYYASKAYVGSYSRAVRYEAARKGVQVCTLYPGTTRTEFFGRAGAKTPFWAMKPDKVAQIAYDGLMKNREMIIPGVVNRLLRLVPVKIKLFAVAALKKAPTQQF